jgi:hypothetical protein
MWFKFVAILIVKVSKVGKSIFFQLFQKCQVVSNQVGSGPEHLDGFDLGNVI